MLEVGGDLDLGQEPLGAEHGGQLGAQHLERDLAVVPQVVREVDGGHAARAELALDAVAVGEGGRKTAAQFRDPSPSSAPARPQPQLLEPVVHHHQLPGPGRLIDLREAHHHEAPCRRA